MISGVDLNADDPRSSSAATPGPGGPTGRLLREVMSRFATGVTVLTVGGPEPHGMTANAVTSLSLDPPLVLCCVAKSAWMHAGIQAAGSFAISVLGANQEQLATYFADRRRRHGAQEFQDISHRTGPRTGAPLLTGSLAWIECAQEQVHDGGDHSIFVGRVIEATCGRGAAGLLFHRGHLGSTDPLMRIA